MRAGAEYDSRDYKDLVVERDAGEMVASPGDLARIVERPVVQMHSGERRWPDFLADDFSGARRAAGEIDWLRASVLATGVVLGAAAFDRTAFRFADRNKDKDWLEDGVSLGDALPVAAVALSGVFAFDPSRPRLSAAGVAALEAGAAAFLGSTALKYAIGRARPDSGAGRHEFNPGESDDRWHSFPSRHTAVMWAAVTPYAKEFGMDWLYGAAAFTNLARTGSREHWFSDTVAGSLLGYALGHIAWEARQGHKNAPGLAVGPGGVALVWDLD